MNRNIPEPVSGGLILSYKCSAECLHCIYGCSPRWSADWITEADLRKVLEQLAGRIQPGPHGSEVMSLNYGLHFTGGEPFLNFRLLCRAVEIARELNIPGLFVETNCFWCRDDESTREKLRLLKEKGLIGIMISVNPFYLEYVPFERTERCIRAGLEIFGHNTAVYQLEYYRRFKELGIKGKVAFKDYLNMERREDLIRNAEFFLMGRAAYKLMDMMGGVFPKYGMRFLAREPCRPPVVREWHNHFDNYGNYVPGYCGGISYGDCRELDRLLRQKVSGRRYPVLRFLMDDDFEGLFHFAAGLGYEEREEGYFSKCHLCTDMRKFIAGKEDFEELTPKEFYVHLE